MTISAIKQRLRDEALGLRGALRPEAHGRLRRALVEHGVDLALRSERTGGVVAAFLPIRGEPDTHPLLAALRDSGFATSLPATPPRGEPLMFRVWHCGEPLMPGRFGTVEPRADQPTVDPDLLFVPLAAFDRRGFRLGYGAGFYDGALRRLRASKPILAIGVAFAVQEVDAVPTEPHDQRLDAVLTERGVTTFGGP